ncbi:hypothetical protein C8Q75DRAFT_812192 [Abortiporus biennis]|nr:hypothetical protein C8Q75DRAFT_812192 [Abortiporus biennis]
MPKELTEHQKRTHSMDPLLSRKEMLLNLQRELRSIVEANLTSFFHAEAICPATQMYWTSSSFWFNIVIQFQVTFINWPEHLALRSPSDITYKLAEYINLVQGWRSGRIRFVKLCEEEFNEMVDQWGGEFDEVAARSLMSRKTRSDLGETRLRRTNPKTRSKTRKSGRLTPRYIDEALENL